MDEQQKAIIRETVIATIATIESTRPRPSQVTQAQAAEMLGLSKPTVCKLVRSGALKLNRCGQIPMTEIDKAIAAQSV